MSWLWRIEGRCVYVLTSEYIGAILGAIDVEMHIREVEYFDWTCTKCKDSIWD